jgi:hypothetical protein
VIVTIIIIIILIRRSQYAYWNQIREEHRNYQRQIVKERKIKVQAQRGVQSSTFTTVEEDPYRPLIIYNYHETHYTRINIGFFISHGLHANADFIFVINGPSDVEKMLPEDAPNIRVIRRDNTCFDLGAAGEVLRANDEELVKKYKRFVVINASVRGPFLPIYAPNCWTDIFLQRLSETVKIVGMNYCCVPKTHVQSMVFATDDVGMKVLVKGNETDTTNLTDSHYRAIAAGNPDSFNGLSKCATDKFKAVSAEISLTNLIYRAGYKALVVRTASMASPTFYEDCLNHTITDWDGHPYDTVFVKANENAAFDRKQLDDLTTFHDGWGYSSWESCRKK